MDKIEERIRELQADKTLLEQQKQEFEENQIYKEILKNISVKNEEISNLFRERRRQKFEQVYNAQIAKKGDVARKNRELETTEELESRKILSLSLQSQYYAKRDEKIIKQFFEIFNPIVQNCVGMSREDAREYLQNIGIKIAPPEDTIWTFHAMIRTNEANIVAQVEIQGYKDFRELVPDYY